MGLFKLSANKVEKKARDTAAFDPPVFNFAMPAVSSNLFTAIQTASSQAYNYIYRSQPAIYTCAEFLATAVAGTGLKVYKRVSDTDREKLSDHPMVDLIRQPSPGLTYSRWIHGMVVDYCVSGNHYELKREQGDLKFLVPLPAQSITPQGGNVVAAGVYDFQLGQKRERFTADEIVHFRRFNPDDARIGISPLEPLRKVLQSDVAAMEHWQKLWANGARIEGWLSHPGALSEDAMTRLQVQVQNQHSGSAGAGKVLVTEEGMKFVPNEWSPREAEFIEGRKLTLETAARALNIPLPVLSLTETATFASQDAFHTQLYVDTLGPIYSMIEEQIMADVLPWISNDPDVYVEFNIEEKLKGSFEQQTTTLRNAVGVPDMSVNESRALKGLPRIDDPEFDTPVQPANIIYGGAGSPGEAPMPDVRQMPDTRPLRAAKAEVIELRTAEGDD